MEITEGKAKIRIIPGKITRQMDVFYNPAMKLNRDLTIAVLNNLPDKNMQAADLLAGSGIRSIRLLKELKPEKIKTLDANDGSARAAKSIKRNATLNKVGKKLKVHNKDANIFLLESKGFDFIDIDPFGYPGPFLDSAAQRLARGGILAITATDTAALSGTSPSACKRKYWARPLRNYFMHESGLRILIRRVQLAAMSYEKALVPIYSYVDQHYMRSFLRCEKGKIDASKIFDQHGYISWCGKCLNTISQKKIPQEKCNLCNNNMEFAGPLWLGKITDNNLATKIYKETKIKLAQLVLEESSFSVPWFYNVNNVCSRYSLKKPRRIDDIIVFLKSKGFNATRTHFDGAGIRTDAQISLVSKSCHKK